MTENVSQDKALVVFQDKKIRRVWHNDEWYFSVVDIVQALTDSSSPRQYWGVLKSREPQLLTFCLQLKLPAEDGKLRETDCANTKNMFRIIQSIPSPKAEPFKLWLAKVGYERVQEIQDPELAQKRMKELYRAKGYSDEWKNRGVDENVEFAILTNDISKATFGKTVEEYKQFKGLKRHNLRDHMNDLELIFTMLGEKVTTEITQTKDSQGLKQCQDSARRGGRVAGKARKEAEKEIGKPITSKESYLSEPEKSKRKRLT